MGLLRLFAAPLGMIVVFIALLVVGFASTQTGWVALALLCVWPLVFGVGAWSLRGLRDSYQLVPKQNQRRAGGRPQEILN
jgi:hypothetical protein